MKLSYLLSSIFVICIAAHTAHSSDLTPAQCLWLINVLIIEATTPKKIAELQAQDEMNASQQSKKKALKYPKTPKCIKRPKIKKHP